MPKGALILLIVGVVLFVLSLAIVAASMVIWVANDPRVTFEETAPFIATGGCCSTLSFAVVVGAIIWWLVARNK